MSSVPSPMPPAPSEHSQPGPFLTMHTALILLTALVIGLIVGGLTFLGGTPAPGAILAGLLSAGISVPALHRLIG
ncbi:hypothetical protein ABZ348_02375 [Streptomyces sp. NPDC005963]|uniref:hypothetical protein n=1 Tax=Streptomyces sp. NPDC005963 TaxID=3156721 RepID=UPI0033C943C2